MAQNKVYWWLTSIVTLAIVLRWAAFVGVVGADDATISDMAQRLLASGPWIPETHYQGRVGLIYPLALIYALFGIGEWQLVAVPFSLGAASIVLAFLIARELCDDRSALIAAVILAVFPLDVAAATQMMPDLPLGVLTATSFYLALKALRNDDPKLWAVASGLAWGYAYLIKVEAVFMAVPFLMLLAIHRRDWRKLFWVFGQRPRFSLLNPSSTGAWEVRPCNVSLQ